jgi:metallo-beta-lactamase class B
VSSTTVRWLFLLGLAACAPAVRRVEPAHSLLTSLRGPVRMHRSTGVVGGQTFTANGLVVGPILVDTAWTPEQTEQLYAETHVQQVLVTHAHEDRMAGLDVLARHGVASYGLERTQLEARAHQRPAPAHTVGEEGELSLGGTRLLYFFPGAAHAPDNLVVYVPAQQVLFGGCMVRALDSGLGPLEDADLKSWQSAIERVRERFPDATLIVPGHGEPGGRELLAHTRALVDAALADEVP